MHLLYPEIKGLKVTECLKGAIIFYRGPSVCGGTKIFWGGLRGGANFYRGKERGQNFFLGPSGGGPEFFSRLQHDFLLFPYQKNFRTFGATTLIFYQYIMHIIIDIVACQWGGVSINSPDL